MPSPTFSVAPMEGLTTFPMRLWLHMVSQPEQMTTPFLKVTRVYPTDHIPFDFVPELFALRGRFSYTITPQFISGDPDQFLRTCDLIPEAVSPVIELNCGCPTPNSMGKLAGSGILADPEFFAREMERLSARLGPGRFAIKMRLGTETDDEFPALLDGLKGLPLARLTIHGRTRKDGYRGHSRWKWAQEAARRLDLPVVASGDVWGIERYQTLAETAPSIAGAMIGRGLMRNPWIFAELREGREQTVSLQVLLSSLFTYALLQDLWHRDPAQLIQRVALGRIGNICQQDEGYWEKEVVELTKLVFGLPFLVTPARDFPRDKISSVAFARLKLLWGYLKTSLPENFANPKIQRTSTLSEFFTGIVRASEDSSLTLAHNPQWDRIYNKGDSDTQSPP